MQKQPAVTHLKKNPEIHMTEFRKPQDESYLKEVALRAKT